MPHCLRSRKGEEVKKDLPCPADPTYAVLHTMACASLDMVVKDIQLMHHEKTPKAILAKVVQFYNESIREEWTSGEMRDEYISLVGDAPGSFAFISGLGTIIGLCETLDPTLRKDDTDERRHTHPRSHERN